jgi:hypothetical protein
MLWMRTESTLYHLLVAECVNCPSKIGKLYWLHMFGIFSKGKVTSVWVETERVFYLIVLTFFWLHTLVLKSDEWNLCMKHWFVQCCWQEKAEYYKKNLYQCHCMYQKSHMDWSKIKPGPSGEWPPSNCISHDNPDVYSNAIHLKSYLNILYFAF